ncbi:MAG: serine--tRNA ligase [Nitrospinota bacterium]|nr:serine--tRNA ligase [Nitrospinota bacterium]
MLDIRQIRENTVEMAAKLQRRGQDFDIEAVATLDKERVAATQRVEELKKERNELSRLTGQRMKNGEKADDLQQRARDIGEEVKGLDENVKRIQDQIRNSLLAIPNIPDDSAPDGPDENSNLQIRQWGEPADFDYQPKSHVELGEALGILDLPRAARMAGARFALYTGAGAAMERALINFMLDIHTRENGYMETIPPYMVNSAAMTGTGQLPKFADDLFRLKDTDYWLIPTAEVPLTNIHADEILKEENLPILFAAYTPCFRAEAGSYGKDTTGLIRQHQFSKVELVKLTTPDQGKEELEKLTANAEGILQKLGLPYRVMALCAGDMGFSAAITYDLEVWLPSQNKYREISSCSWCTDYQARRANLRYSAAPKDGKKGKGKTTFLHTLNGSGLAVGRTWVAIMENFQNADGSVTIPPALRPYMGGMEKIARP